jgi:hypothetical protein
MGYGWIVEMGRKETKQGTGGSTTQIDDDPPNNNNSAPWQRNTEQEIIKGECKH